MDRSRQTSGAIAWSIRIGRGAMGAVYSAVDEQLNRSVAVKLMLLDFDQDPELRERFEREDRITASWRTQHRDGVWTSAKTRPAATVVAS